MIEPPRNRLPRDPFRAIGRTARDWIAYLDWSTRETNNLGSISNLDPVTREWVECLLQRRRECRDRLVRHLRRRDGEPIDAGGGWTLHLSRDANGLAFIHERDYGMKRGDAIFRPGSPMPALWSDQP